MHEAAITKSIIQTTLNSIIDKKIEKVIAIKLKIGKMHSIVVEVLLNHFNIFKKEYKLLETSELDIEELEVMILCKTCHEQMNLEEVFFICHKCGSNDIDLIQGDEMHIVSIEGEA